jgi:DNA polymerase III delta subunit
MLQIIVGKALRTVGQQEIHWEALPIEELASLAVSQNMFGGTETYLLVGAINSERQEDFLAIAKDLAASPNLFIFEEEKLLKAPTVVLEKAGAEIVVEKRPSTSSAQAQRGGFDPFGLTFAFAARDRKKLWLGLMQAFKAGEKAEAVAGLLTWKVRQELERATGKKREDLVRLSRQLVYMYHDSHRGAGDLELLLERFALRL